MSWSSEAIKPPLIALLPQQAGFNSVSAQVTREQLHSGSNEKGYSEHGVEHSCENGAERGAERGAEHGSEHGSECAAEHALNAAPNAALNTLRGPAVRKRRMV